MEKILLNFQYFDDIGRYYGNQELIYTRFQNKTYGSGTAGSWNVSVFVRNI